MAGSAACVNSTSWGSLGGKFKRQATGHWEWDFAKAVDAQ
jgi:hypothetical protein